MDLERRIDGPGVDLVHDALHAAQQVGGIELPVTSAEITYGLGRLATYLQGVDSLFELEWAPGVTLGEMQKMFEVEFSKFNFELADIDFHRELFDKFESEAYRLLDEGLVTPGYDYVLKCSHTFNVLDARGAISVTERTGYITRVRKLARKVWEISERLCGIGEGSG